jgi:formate hydrogenlyase subunit 3/multisubunit Na+/H+ antiporter MnhD subunit
VKYIILAIVVGTLVLAAIVIYYIASGTGKLKQELAEARRETREVEGRLSVARHGLLEIASGQAGQPIMTAIATITDIENYVPQKEIR